MMKSLLQIFRRRPGAPVRVAVDLIRLGCGGQNGGIKPFIFDFLQWVAKERGSEFVFIYFTRSSLVSEVEAFRRDVDWHICVGESEGCAMPAAGANRHGLVATPEAATNWFEHWPTDALYAPLGLSPFCRPDLPWMSLVADTLHRDRPEMLSATENAYRDRWMRDGLAQAGAVQCISHFTRQQLVRHFGAPAGKLFVTHYAIPDRLRAAVAPAQATSPSRRPYFFYPANDWPHKNHDALFEAYAAYRRQAGAAAWDLTLSGHCATPEMWQKRIAALGLTGACRLLGHVESEKFIAIFQQAGALVFPSLYEGFGIPVLEAMTWGVPVACSRAGSLPEVAGNAVLFFDAAQPADIARAMGQIAGDGDLRRQLISAGRKRARTFSLAREAGRLADRLIALSQRNRTGPQG